VQVQVSIQNVATEPTLVHLQADELQLVGQSDFARFGHAYLVGYHPKQKSLSNENFVREVIELFTLGENHYTGSDIKEAARAFTGYRIDGPNQSFKFIS